MIAWNTDSGTVELPALRRGLPLAEQYTQEIEVPYLKPPVRIVYMTPGYRLRQRLRNLRWSRFAADIEANGTLIVCCAAVLALAGGFSLAAWADSLTPISTGAWH